ncbi:VOC family protein [Methylomonas sp. MED-D]|uniref:Glyoxalase n=1 Tax=Methylomonas koyamae TaxID=702114 RepID=A0A177PFR5_9GAMM|nr:MULTISPECIES: VOC family protein [Methylomonas]MDT4331872.1 VOC family protein [Methylomonas sp. MV1]OAI29207.1 glyoxalase [Methylomonas koyamae]
MSNPTLRHGTFSWCELLTTDPAAAKDFYANLFDWTLEPAPNAPPGVDYSVAKLDGEPVAGMMAIPPGAAGMPPHWGSYITVNDVDATVARATALGASVCVPPQDIPKLGRFSMLQDPQGAVFGIISYLPTHCG